MLNRKLINYMIFDHQDEELRKRQRPSETLELVKIKTVLHSLIVIKIALISYERPEMRELCQSLLP